MGLIKGAMYAGAGMYAVNKFAHLAENRQNNNAANRASNASGYQQQQYYNDDQQRRSASQPPMNDDYQRQQMNFRNVSPNRNLNNNQYSEAQGATYLNNDPSYNPPAYGNNNMNNNGRFHGYIEGEESSMQSSRGQEDNQLNDLIRQAAQMMGSRGGKGDKDKQNILEKLLQK